MAAAERAIELRAQAARARRLADGLNPNDQALLLSHAQILEKEAGRIEREDKARR
jgi:hypothetical protein